MKMKNIFYDIGTYMLTIEGKINKRKTLIFSILDVIFGVNSLQESFQLIAYVEH